MLRGLISWLISFARRLFSDSLAVLRGWMSSLVNLARLLFSHGSRILGFGSACASVYGIVYISRNYSEEGVARHMCSVFEAGGVSGWDSCFIKDQLLGHVDRPQVHQDITALLEPDAKAQYAVIVGAAGTGKSTAVRKALSKLSYPKGAVYFLPPSLLAGFSSALAKTLGFRRPIGWVDRVVRLFIGETNEQEPALPSTSEPHATWQKLEPCIFRAAVLYASKHKAPAVLVLDGMDLVAKKDPEFFLVIQDFAKKCADTGVLSIVLVFSEGRALPLLQSSSAITRAGVIYEVGDISDQDAEKWLRKEYNVEATRAAALVAQVAGGRFPLLRMCGSSSKSVDAISKELDIKVEEDLQQVGVPPTAPLFRALLSSASMERGEAHHLLPKHKVQELLSANILSAHPDRTYTFHDRHVARFMARAAADKDVARRRRFL